MISPARTVHIFTIAICCLLTIHHALAHPLQADSTDLIDFSGHIRKFDPNFNGIGPKVYFLPAPPSAEELLSQQYQEKQYETIAIPKMLSKIGVLSELKTTGGLNPDPTQLTGPHQSIEGWMLMELERATALNDRNRMADIQNMLAREYFRIGALEEAFQFLEQALLIKTELKKQDDIMAIHYNLATLYHYNDDLAASRDLYEKILQYARQQNDSSQQAESMMRLAYIKAKQGSYDEAERDLIRTVIPMYRNLRNTTGDNGRLLAYNTLADVYRLQNRYPEAQWFMLQAKEVADEKMLKDQLPMIFFNLAEIKKSSGNKMVAINEYKLAEELAGDRSGFLVMRLAIQDALGDIYHENGNFKEALEALNRYDSLKEQLILVDFPF